jgi:hypothetical protein
VIAGNFIGTNVHGTGFLRDANGNMAGNSIGVGSVGGESGDTIGVTGINDAVGRNIISGNMFGVVINAGFPAPPDHNMVVAGNYIGTDVTGTQPLGNVAEGVGVADGAYSCTIGGASAALGNVIAYNGTGDAGRGSVIGMPFNNAPGVIVTNYGGRTSTGINNPTGIHIEGNSIYENGGLGIDLVNNPDQPLPDSVTPNDSQGHTWPNHFQDFPVLTSATSSSTSTLITGSFDSGTVDGTPNTPPFEPNTTITLDFYATDTEDATQHGQGQTYLGSRTVYTDTSGHVSFSADFAVGTAGQWISATATDEPNPSLGTLGGNTSEFSLDMYSTSAPNQTFTQSLPAALPQSTTSPNTLTIQADPTTINDVVSGLSTTNLGQSVVPVSVYLNLAPGTYTQQNGTGYTLNLPTGMTLYINGTTPTNNQVPTTIDPASPAFTVASGNVVVSNVTFVTTGDAPTILVTGGSLTLRNCVVQESTGYSDPAIALTGGTVDLGTSASPGDNVINVNGAGEFVHNTTPNAVAAVGVSFQANGAALTSRDLSFTTLVGSSAVPLLGEAVTFTATVRANAGGAVSPGGSVDFFDATTSTDLGSVPLSGGSAALTTSALAVGSHVIWARYGGDDNFLLSQDSTPVTVIPPASLSGVVWEDFNDDGQVDFGERGIAGVPITLTGTDDLGHAVNQTQQTDGDGAYVFLNLRPGCYTISETQPAGYTQGTDSVGTAGGSLAATDQFFVCLSQGVNGLNYNFGEQPPAGGSVQKGQTAGIGFWNNRNGQALIKALPVVTNADGSVTSVANWLAATLPNIFGKNAANDLTGQSNAAVAALFQADFLLKGLKLDAQVLATALSVYATNATLDPTRVAANYGFTVSGDGVGTATVNVGSNGDAFGVADNTTMTVMDLLLATNNQAVNGLLYNGNATKRAHANNVYSAVNNAGDIG